MLRCLSPQQLLVKRVLTKEFVEFSYISFHFCRPIFAYFAWTRRIQHRSFKLRRFDRKPHYKHSQLLSTNETGTLGVNKWTFSSVEIIQTYLIQNIRVQRNNMQFSNPMSIGKHLNCLRSAVILFYCYSFLKLHCNFWVSCTTYFFIILPDRWISILSNSVLNPN